MWDFRTDRESRAELGGPRVACYCDRVDALDERRDSSGCAGARHRVVRLERQWQHDHRPRDVFGERELAVVQQDRRGHLDLVGSTGSVGSGASCRPPPMARIRREPCSRWDCFTPAVTNLPGSTGCASDSTRAPDGPVCCATPVRVYDSRDTGGMLACRVHANDRAGVHGEARNGRHRRRTSWRSDHPVRVR